MKGQKLFWIIFLTVFLPLFVGLIIYLLYKPKLIPLFSFPNSAAALSGKNLFTKLMVNSGPDFCWSYSFASALFITNFIFFRSKLFTYATVILIILAELIQIFLPRYFTFDWMDLGAAVIAVFISYLILKNRFLWLLKRQNG